MAHRPARYNVCERCGHVASYHSPHTTHHEICDCPRAVATCPVCGGERSPYGQRCRRCYAYKRAAERPIQPVRLPAASRSVLTRLATRLQRDEMLLRQFAPPGTSLETLGEDVTAVATLLLRTRRSLRHLIRTHLPPSRPKRASRELSVYP